jgi:hypothetical protein
MELVNRDVQQNKREQNGECEDKYRAEHRMAQPPENRCSQPDHDRRILNSRLGSVRPDRPATDAA